MLGEPFFDVGCRRLVSSLVLDSLQEVTDIGKGKRHAAGLFPLVAMGKRAGRGSVVGENSCAGKLIPVEGDPN